MCHYFTLAKVEIVEELNKIMKIESTSSLEALVDSIKSQKKQMVFLIDEADSIVKHKERETITSTFRKLSQEGDCTFVLAGFWGLYEDVTMNYQSALKNFGEVIELKGLEEEACRDLMIKPMQRIGVEYENKTMVSKLIERCGRRANLIATVCDQVLKNSDNRIIGQEDIELSIDSERVRGLLSEWEFLAGEKLQNDINQLVVYLTYDKESFTLSDIVDLIKEQKIKVPIKQVEESLKIFVLAYIFKRTKNVYSYQVPLLKEYLLADPTDVENQLFGVLEGLN